MLRGKILLWSLLAMGVVAVAMGIVQMWWQPMVWELFGKTLITLLVCGTLVSFLIAVDYDLPGSRSKILMAAAVLLGLFLTGIILAQLWWDALAWGAFVRWIITDVMLLGLVSFILAVKEDFGTHQSLKDEKYLD